MEKRKGLNTKGLDALFSAPDLETSDSAGVLNVRISDIEPDKNQPRKIFTDDALKSLSESIERHGVLQPLVVRKANADSALHDVTKYSIISGERRWRAAKMAGLTEVPVVVKDISDTDAAAIMLVENLQREDLNPVEQALGLKRLIDEFGLTHEQTAAIVGISRPALTNSLRLLSLPDEVLDSLSSGDITAGHARALLSLGNQDDILDALQSVVGKGLSVRETESLVKKLLSEKDKKQTQTVDISNLDDKKIYIAKLEEKISSKFGRKAKLVNNKKSPDKGVLEIEYYSKDDLEALLKNLCGNDIFAE